MTSIKRPALALGAAALMTVSLAACGGSDASGAPKDASKADFCKAYEGDSSAYSGLKQDDYAKFTELIHQQADDLAKVGTPKGISDDARKGFELEVEGAKKLDAGDIEKAAKDDDNSDDILNKAAGFSDDDAKKVDAFDEYANNLCE